MRQRMAQKLQDIERARKLASEARVAAARSEAAGALDKRDEAARSLDAAEEGWAGYLGSGFIDLELGKSVGAQVLRQESELMLRSLGLEAAEKQLESELAGWRMVEARVRSGERKLQAG